MNPSLGHMAAPRARASSSQFFSWQVEPVSLPSRGLPPGGMQVRHAGSAMPDSAGKYPLVFLQNSSQVGMYMASCLTSCLRTAMSEDTRLPFNWPFPAFANSAIDFCMKLRSWMSAGTSVLAATHSMNPSLGHIPAPRARANSSQFLSMQVLAFTDPLVAEAPAGIQLRQAGSARPGRYPFVFLHISSQVGMAVPRSLANCFLMAMSVAALSEPAAAKQTTHARIESFMAWNLDAAFSRS